MYIMNYGMIPECWTNSSTLRQYAFIMNVQTSPSWLNAAAFLDADCFSHWGTKAENIKIVIEDSWCAVGNLRWRFSYVALARANIGTVGNRMLYYSTSSTASRNEI